MSVCLTVCLSAFLSLSLCFSIRPFPANSHSICISVCMSVCQSVSLSVCQSVSLSVCQSVSLSVCQSVRFSACLSFSVSATLLVNLPSYLVTSQCVLSVCLSESLLVFVQVLSLVSQCQQFYRTFLPRQQTRECLKSYLCGKTLT